MGRYLSLLFCLLFLVIGVVYPAITTAQVSKKEVKETEQAKTSEGVSLESLQDKLNKDVQSSKKIQKDVQKQKEQRLQQQLRQQQRIR